MGAISEGDTGGPVIFTKDRGPECVIGIASFSVKRSLFSRPEVFNIFTIAGAFEQWLEETADLLSAERIAVIDIVK